jgi:hypothetical protein
MVGPALQCAESALSLFAANHCHGYHDPEPTLPVQLRHREARFLSVLRQVFARSFRPPRQMSTEAQFQNVQPNRCTASGTTLVFLLPFVVMLWIGLSLLHRRMVVDSLRFVLILPVCFVATMSWVRGFHDALPEASRTYPQ